MHYNRFITMSCTAMGCITKKSIAILSICIFTSAFNYNGWKHNRNRARHDGSKIGILDLIVQKSLGFSLILT